MTPLLLLIKYLFQHKQIKIKSCEVSKYVCVCVWRAHMHACIQVHYMCVWGGGGGGDILSWCWSRTNMD